jgi:hypothetical protein
MSDAPFHPQRVQRAAWRNRSLETSGLHRMMSGAKAMGAQCVQSLFPQWTQNHGDELRSSASVGTGGTASRVRRFGASS